MSVNQVWGRQIYTKKKRKKKENLTVNEELVRIRRCNKIVTNKLNCHCRLPSYHLLFAGSILCQDGKQSRTEKASPPPQTKNVHIFIYSRCDDVGIFVVRHSFFSSVVVRLGVKSGGKFFVVVVVGDLWASSALCLCRNVRPCCASLNFWLLTSLLAPIPYLY